MKNKSLSAKAALFAAALSVVIAVFFTIYGLVNTYFDTVVLACDLIAAVCFALYAVKDAAWSEYLGLVAVLAMSYGLAIFFLNSYTVWADWYGNFDMYGSRGGIAPVIIQLAMILITLIIGIVSCFTTKGGKKA